VGERKGGERVEREIEVRREIVFVCLSEFLNDGKIYFPKICLV